MSLSLGEKWVARTFDPFDRFGLEIGLLVWVGVGRCGDRELARTRTLALLRGCGQAAVDGMIARSDVAGLV